MPARRVIFVDGTVTGDVEAERRVDESDVLRDGVRELAAGREGERERARAGRGRGEVHARTRLVLVAREARERTPFRKRHGERRARFAVDEKERRKPTVTAVQPRLERAAARRERHRARREAHARHEVDPRRARRVRADRRRDAECRRHAA